MTARNDITGDLITTKGPSEAYRNNFDAIFGKKKEQKKYRYFRHVDGFADDIVYVRVPVDETGTADCLCRTGMIEVTHVDIDLINKFDDTGVTEPSDKQLVLLRLKQLQEQASLEERSAEYNRDHDQQ